MTEIADWRQTGHACTTLESVQLTLQLGDDLAVLRVLPQLGHQAVGQIQDLGPFLKEDFQQLPVKVGAFQGLIGMFVHRHPRSCRGLGDHDIHRLRRCRVDLRCFGLGLSLNRLLFLNRGGLLQVIPEGISLGTLELRFDRVEADRFIDFRALGQLQIQFRNVPIVAVAIASQSICCGLGR